MISNYGISTNLEIFYFCIFDYYEANIGPISTTVFSYKFDMLFSFLNNWDISDHQF